MDFILYLAATPEYWAGVGSTLFVLLAGTIVLLVFRDPAEAALPATPHPDWLKSSDELSRAAAARKAKADAQRWGRHGARGEQDSAGGGPR